MAVDEKISELTEATTLANTDLVTTVQSGVNKKITGANIRTEVNYLSDDGSDLTPKSAGRNIDIDSGATYKVDNNDVLSEDTLGNGVVNSNLTNVGTLTSLQVDNISINGSSITATTAMNFTNSGSLNAMTIGTTGAASRLTLKASSNEIVLTPSSSFGVRISAGGLSLGSLSFANNDIKTQSGTNANIDMAPNGSGKINFAKPTMYEVAGVLSVVAATGITLTQDEIIPVESSTAGDTNITSNPQIVAGSTGEKRTIIGTDAVKTVTLDDGDGLALTGGASITLGLNDTIDFIFYNSLWLETSRSIK